MKPAPSILRHSALLVSLVPAVAAQDFGPQQAITTQARGAHAVHATDLDGDGDADVISGAGGNFQNQDVEIAWYENLGGGVFGPTQVLHQQPDIFLHSWLDVSVADLDGDGDADVLSATQGDNKVAWYENLGSGSFGPQQVLTTAANGAVSVANADLDGDGDVDVVSGSQWDGKVAWYENLGGGLFGSQQVITSAASGANSVAVTDIDGDGDADVLSTSFDDKVAWYENLGGGGFGPQQVISTTVPDPTSVDVADLDGDGDADVLIAARGSILPGNSRVSWFENLGAGAFGPEQVITIEPEIEWSYSAQATDLDGDGDADVLYSSYYSSKVAWNENLGAGAFGPQQVITTSIWSGQEVFAADLDGDGAVDVLSASEGDDKITWYENLMNPCAATNYCTAQTNSSGGPAGIGFQGTSNLGVQDLVLNVLGAPSGMVGVFFYADQQGFAPFGEGNLCLTPPFYVIRTAVTTSASGTARLLLDSTSPPLGSGPGQVSAFETWYFQFWFRDPLGGPAGFNASDGLAVTFCP